MRRLCQSTLQSRCAQKGVPFHAGRAVFQVFQKRDIAASPRHLDRKDPGIRWYEQVGPSKKDVRPMLDENFEGEEMDAEAGEEFLKDLEKEIDSLEKGEETLMEEPERDEEHEEAGVEEEEIEEDGDRLTLVEERETQKFEEGFEKKLADLKEMLAIQEQEGNEFIEDEPEGEQNALISDRGSAGIKDAEDPGENFQDVEKDFEELSKNLQDFTDLEVGSEDHFMEKKDDPDSAYLRELGLFDAKLDTNESTDLESLELDFQLPQALKARIKDFNNAIKDAAANISQIYQRRTLWLAYMRCKRMVPGFLEQMSDSAWRVLWQSQSADPFFNEQAAHLLVLADDMRITGKQLTNAQKLLCIKAFEADDRVNEALSMWHKERRWLADDSHLRYEFNALGVTLECAIGKPERAEAIALLNNSGRNKDAGAARLLIPVIGAWARVGSEEALQRAWGLYLMLRKTLVTSTKEENRMTAEDHDDIFISFLDAGQRNMALVVFKDLIVAGQNSHYDSISLARSMGLGLEKLHSNQSVPEKLNEVSLEALIKLPKRFENKYFYASWMKRLIGMGRVDAAALVVELMYERGVSPDAKHINGVVGAWLRQGNQDEQNRALDLAWSMVQQRLEFIEQRYKTTQNGAEDKGEAVSKAVLPTFIQRKVPRATTETFCLLLLYYASKNVVSSVERVKQLLSVAELQPNSYFMNHLMLAYSNQGKPTEAWALFTDMSQKVAPEMASFSYLWNVAGKMTSLYEQMDRFPGPRRLFSTMMDWFSQLDKKNRAAAIEEFGPEVYNQIVRTFCRWKDVNGTLIAMYALRDAFGTYPDGEVMRLVCLQIAQLSERRQAPHALGKPRTRRRKKATGDMAKNVESATKALEMLLANRRAELATQNVNLEGLNDQESGEERLYILAELLRATERRTLDLTETHELSEKLDQVAWEMGAGPFKMGPPVYNTQTQDTHLATVQ